MGEFDGKVAIVTGAGRLRGIGRAAAVGFAKLGANVVVTGTGRDPSTFPDDEKAVNWRDIHSVADQIESHGVKALPLIADVTNTDHVQNMIDQAVKEFGRVDMLVNNAAFARGPDRVPVLELDDGIFQKVIDIKIGGTYLCTKAFVAQLQEQGTGGKIVNISSSAGKRGSASTLAYNAANFAIVGMTQSMAREFGPMGINVNCVCPGAVDTHRMDDIDRETRWSKWPKPPPLGATELTTKPANSAFICVPRPPHGFMGSPSMSMAARLWNTNVPTSLD